MYTYLNRRMNDLRTEGILGFLSSLLGWNILGLLQPQVSVYGVATIMKYRVYRPNVRNQYSDNSIQNYYHVSAF